MCQEKASFGVLSSVCLATLQSCLIATPCKPINFTSFDSYHISIRIIYRLSAFRLGVKLYQALWQLYLPWCSSSWSFSFQYSLDSWNVFYISFQPITFGGVRRKLAVSKQRYLECVKDKQSVYTSLRNGNSIVSIKYNRYISKFEVGLGFSLGFE